jgi:hypothetical protein
VCLPAGVEGHHGVETHHRAVVHGAPSPHVGVVAVVERYNTTESNPNPTWVRYTRKVGKLRARAKTTAPATP